MATKFNYKLYLVTDQKACLYHDLFQVVKAAIKGGVDIVQIREKELPEKAFYTKALQLKELLDKLGIPLIVNDSLPVAMQINASGIHVGNSDLQPVSAKQLWPASRIIGYSLEDLAQLKSADAATADYIALSPVFSTPTKTNTIIEWGLAGIRQVRPLTKKPLVAIGNINSSNARAVVRAGADCLAVISDICSARDPERAAANIRNEIEKAASYDIL